MSEGKQLNDTVFNFGFTGEVADRLPDASRINTCIQCGSCSSSCVAAEGMGTTPRKLWRAVQMGMEEEAMSSDNFWNCTTCALCEKRCPRGIPLSSIIIRLRELNVKKDGILPKIELAADTIEKSRNITGDPQENRFLWIGNMGLDAQKTSALVKEKADAVYFTGCVSALFPQAYKIPQALASLLLKINADFTLLEDEWCCGYPLIASGKGLEAVKDLAEHNMEQIRKKGASTVLVSCPTCYYMFKKLYSKVLGGVPELKILHYSEYLIDIVRKNSLGFIEDEIIVTYHDPCDLGRKLHITGQPRELIKAIPGVRLAEMRFSGEESKCCGGGGNLEMINPKLSAEIAGRRVEEAVATGASCLLTGCQQCRRTLQNAVRKARARLKVYDMIEFLEARLKVPDGGGAE